MFNQFPPYKPDAGVNIVDAILFEIEMDNGEKSTHVYGFDLVIRTDVVCSPIRSIEVSEDNVITAITRSFNKYIFRMDDNELSEAEKLQLVKTQPLMVHWLSRASAKVTRVILLDQIPTAPLFEDKPNA